MFGISGAKYKVLSTHYIRTYVPEYVRTVRSGHTLYSIPYDPLYILHIMYMLYILYILCDLYILHMLLYRTALCGEMPGVTAARRIYGGAGSGPLVAWGGGEGTTVEGLVYIV